MIKRIKKNIANKLYPVEKLEERLVEVERKYHRLKGKNMIVVHPKVIVDAKNWPDRPIILEGSGLVIENSVFNAYGRNVTSLLIDGKDVWVSNNMFVENPERRKRKEELEK